MIVSSLAPERMLAAEYHVAPTLIGAGFFSACASTPADDFAAFQRTLPPILRPEG
jgi:hypothetical protein